MIEDYENIVKELGEAAEHLARQFSKIANEVEKLLEAMGSAYPPTNVRKTVNCASAKYTARESYYRNQRIPSARKHRVQKRGYQ
ncbi:MAG: hypothetical protein IJN11_05490 [Oscillospiraceae bacterium]|nr:hypothetical protein [Oscillospiraceae bacterium]